MALTQQAISDHFPFLPVVITIGGFEIEADALIDTGFDGHVIIPVELLPDDIGPPYGYLSWRLADGSDVFSPYYLGIARLAGLEPEFPALITVLGEELIIGRAFTNNFNLILDHGRRVIAEF